MTQTKIDRTEWYSLQDIVRDKMFPWATSFWSVRNVVKKDLKNGNVLAVMKKGRGTGVKYHFKGENIINFINLVESGKIRL